MSDKLVAQQHRYGVSHELFVSTKSIGSSLVMGGVGTDYGPWTRVLTQRAAQLLWFNLTNLLFPERAHEVTMRAVTAPLRSTMQPEITVHLQVVRTADGYFEIIGWVKRETWWVRLHEQEARQLWTRLDIELYPVGWEGRSTKPVPKSG